ncbi:MAG: phage protease [Victivallaceae bacterium]|nr:phage protease [Victivallaceae bacterium]
MFKILTFTNKNNEGNVLPEADGSARFDGLALAADGNKPVIEKDAEGVPTAWRLLKLGTNELTRCGQRIDLVMSADELDAIIDYHNEKGVQIPVDSNHFLKHLADKLGYDESAALELVPSGKAAMAFGNLQKRKDGLWFNNVKFRPLAREMMKEGVFRYFSPVIRGLSDGRLRVTSVAMENEPSINNQDALAASADRRDDFPAFKQPQKEKMHMKLLCKALAGLLGIDSVALSADGEAPEELVSKINALKDELPGLRAAKDHHGGFVGKLRDSLALGADADESTIQGTIMGLKTKADGADSLKTRVDSLELAAENGKKDKLIEKGLAEGKLANSMLEWARGLDSVALSAYLENAPQVIPLKKLNKGDLPEGDSITLSAEDREVCKKAGISEEDFLAEKKANKKQ